jgi:hypothetical protein
MRTLRAALLAPLLPSFTAAILAYINHSPYHPITIFILFYVMLCIAQPVVAVISRNFLLRRQNTLTYAALGFLIAPIPVAVLVLYYWSSGKFSILTLIFLYCLVGLFGACANSIFWWLLRAQLRRPRTSDDIS